MWFSGSTLKKKFRLCTYFGFKFNTCVAITYYNYISLSIYIFISCILFVKSLLRYHWIKYIDNSFHKVIDITYITYRIREYMMQYIFKDNDLHNHGHSYNSS